MMRLINIKEGDKLWYSKTEYVTATGLYGTWDAGTVDTVNDCGELYVFATDIGSEIDGDLPSIIKVTRKVDFKKQDADYVAWLSENGLLGPAQMRRLKRIAERMRKGYSE